MRILHLSDLHFCPEYDKEKQIQIVFETLKSTPCDYILFSGDLIEYSNFEDFILPDSSNFIWTIGNHDVYPYSPHRPPKSSKDLKKIDQSEDNFIYLQKKSLLGPWPYRFDLDNLWSVLVLDTVIKGIQNFHLSGLGVMNLETRNWISNQMQTLQKEGRKAIWLMHHFPFTWQHLIPFNSDFIDLDEVQNLIIKMKPALVLCGHAHRFFGVHKLGESLVINSASRMKLRNFNFHLIDLKNTIEIRGQTLKF